MSTGVRLRWRLVAESRSFRKYCEQSGGGSARHVHAGLPFADRLLPGAQFVGELLLSQTQVLPEGANALTIPVIALSACHYVCMLEKTAESVNNRPSNECISRTACRVTT